MHGDRTHGDGRTGGDKATERESKMGGAKGGRRLAGLECSLYGRRRHAGNYQRGSELDLLLLHGRARVLFIRFSSTRVVCMVSYRLGGE
jgi:hypothetical protein